MAERVPIMPGALPKREVVGTGITLGSFDAHVRMITALGAAQRSSYVCCVNAHMAVEAARDPAFRAVVNGADLATADGMPLLRCLQWIGGERQDRVAGNDLMPALLDRAAEQGLSVYLYGGREEVLTRIRDRAARELPALRIAGAHAPPFRALSDAEMKADAGRINASGAHIVMVSLGCPKQERWMAAMRPSVNAVMLGLGGAFLLYAGVDTRAPKWMRELSLEWLYRLALEPGRLWKRYLVTNTLFLGLAMKAAWQRIAGRRSGRVAPRAEATALVG
ncbi:MAG TPA: WecB/TagA/CpsF family glycosyltransferase [Flavobacteriales bacterium]|nr:WecB/TagA/CpsF family glycosyltransferase [Flavobacteriales bacterium]HMR27514.1 WecB/TagA/CpsF family glycosyltransferase [Flavobacteriales bacterium]